MTQTFHRARTFRLPDGYRVRPAQMSDLEMVAAMLNAYSRVMLGVEQHRLKDMQAELVSPDFHLDQDTCLVFASDDRLAGYAEFWDTIAPYVCKVVWARVHPDFWGLGVGATLVDWGEERAIQQVDRAPQDARVVLRSSVSASDAKAQGLFQGLGYDHIRTYWRMVRELSGEPEVPVWPEGITVRSLKRGEERKAISAAYEAFHDHWGFVPESFDNYVERWSHIALQNDEYDPDLWFVAEENDEIVGESFCYARGLDDPEMGWVGNLAVRRPWRKRGIGLALLQHSIGELYRRGSQRVGLGVDSQNLTGATRLYERAGMHPDPVWTELAYEKELRPGVELSMRPEQS